MSAPVEIPIDVDLEHRARVVAGTAGVRVLCFEAQSGDIEAINEYINYANDAVFFNVIVDAFGKQGALLAILAFDEAAHSSPLRRKAVFYFSAGVFTRSRPIARIGHPWP
jgi:hypothetical protein